jgi:solute:Na+ symporter, SSS family
MNLLLLGISAYIVVQLLVGLLVTRHIATESDYLLAGRRIGLGLGSFSVFATWFGAETCIGAAGSVYRSGLSGGSSDPFGYSICLLLMGLLFAAPLYRLRLTTLADLLRERFSPGVERLLVCMLAPTSVIWAGAQIRAFGQVISASSDLTVELAITAAALVVVVYTVFGGLLADVVTDFVQGLALILGLAVLFFAVLEANGGWVEAMARIPVASWQLRSAADQSAWQVLERWAIPIAGSMFAQELVSRILASRSQATAKGACLVGGGIYLAVGLLPLLIGLVGAQTLPGLENPEQILPRLAQQHLSEFLYVIFAGALISAILSTVDSALLAASALVSHNLLIPILAPMDESAKLKTSRMAVVAFGMVAYALALVSESVHDLVEQASSFSGAGVFVVILFALFTRFGGALSAVCSLLAGMFAWLLGKHLWHLATPYLVSMWVAVLAYFAAACAEPMLVKVQAHRG